MKTLFVIMARSGSKGVKKKNIREIAGLPLIAYKIIAASKCNLEKRIILSTDSTEIAEVASKYGKQEEMVPFLRPAELATDTAQSVDVIMHTMKWVEQNENQMYDYVCMLEPSSPFTSHTDLEAAVSLITQRKGDTLLGMKEVPVNTCFIHELDENGKLSYFYKAIKDMPSIRRQDQKKQYTMNGCIYLARWEYFKQYKSFHSYNSIPYIMDEYSSIEIDTETDLELASMYAEKNFIKLSEWI